MSLVEVVSVDFPAWDKVARVDDGRAKAKVVLLEAVEVL